MIHREQLVKKYNPLLKRMNPHSPLTLGNGDFAFGADVTGLQTFYEEYEKACPVLTMCSNEWHFAPFPDGTSPKITLTEYESRGRILKYPVNCFRNEEKAYDYLRENPHRFNLMRIGFLLDSRRLLPEDISDVDQTLDLYTGILTSTFKTEGKEVTVETAVGENNTLAFKVDSKLLKDRLTIEVSFPYPSPGITGSDFNAKDKHRTIVKRSRILRGHEDVLLKREIDSKNLYVHLSGGMKIEKSGSHDFTLSLPEQRSTTLSGVIGFSDEENGFAERTYKQVCEESMTRFYTFWNRGAFIDVTGSSDKRAEELERRIILSMYLSFVQCTSTLPPQETGLTCNSWYGKFHIEMHPVHAAYLALYGRGDLLERSFGFYLGALKNAKRIAKENGFKGARWPKMTDPTAENSPSVIAPLLIWQQPHIIYMLELLRLSRYSESRVEVPAISEKDFLEKYRVPVEETAEFMADFAIYDEKTDRYILPPPLYSVQEKGNPSEIINPGFEIEYWKFGLNIAADWLEKLSVKDCGKYRETAAKMAVQKPVEGLLPAYEGYSKTYTDLNMDHPSMLFGKGLLSAETDEEALLCSIKEFKDKWDFDSLWGWDFAFLAMTLAKLGRYDEAFDMLLSDAAKNSYGINGNNFQGERKDLPLYLPGNGALLLAMSALRSTKNWYIETEGIMEYPF